MSTLLQQKTLAGISGLLMLIGCTERSMIPEQADMGTDPLIPQVADALLPTVNIAPAKGWPEGALPIAADGLKVNAFADNLDHPRWMLVLPNGDLLVAESNKPSGSGGIKGLKGWIGNLVQKRAGAGVESADRISLLRDTDDDGIADQRHIFLDNLMSPFGMALVDSTLYIANTDALLAFNYRPGQTRINQPGQFIAPLPAGELNHHWTKNILASEDGQTLYVAVGSNSNVGENGMAVEENRAAILQINAHSGTSRVFASGLRNPVGLDWHPTTGELWTTVNERDELGSDLVPDYLTSVNEGDFFGWPYSYWGQIIDARVSPQKPALVASARKPDYALGAHTASLGLAFYDHPALPQYRHGALIGQHGSWNRRPHSGYKVVFVPFEDGLPFGKPLDVLSGFLSDDETALGRPAGVSIGLDGEIFVADDVGNIIWRVVAEE